MQHDEPMIEDEDDDDDEDDEDDAEAEGMNTTLIRRLLFLYHNFIYFSILG